MKSIDKLNVPLSQFEKQIKIIQVKIDNVKPYVDLLELNKKIKALRFKLLQEERILRAETEEFNSKMGQIKSRCSNKGQFIQQTQSIRQSFEMTKQACLIRAKGIGQTLNNSINELKKKSTVKFKQFHEGQYKNNKEALKVPTEYVNYIKTVFKQVVYFIGLVVKNSIRRNPKDYSVIVKFLQAIGWIEQNPINRLVYKELFLISYDKERDGLVNFFDYTMYPKLVYDIVLYNLKFIFANGKVTISPICFEFLLKVGLLSEWSDQSIKRYLQQIPGSSKLIENIFTSLFKCRSPRIQNCHQSWEIYLRMTQIYVRYTNDSKKIQQLMISCLNQILNKKYQVNCSSLLQLRYIYECLNTALSFIVAGQAKEYGMLIKYIQEHLQHLMGTPPNLKLRQGEVSRIGILIEKLNNVRGFEECQEDPEGSLWILFCFQKDDTVENPISVIYNIWICLIRMFPVVMKNFYIKSMIDTIVQRNQFKVYEKVQNKRWNDLESCKKEKKRLDTIIQQTSNYQQMKNASNQLKQMKFQFSKMSSSSLIGRMLSQRVRNLESQLGTFLRFETKVEEINRKIGGRQLSYDQDVNNPKRPRDPDLRHVQTGFRFISWSIEKFVRVSNREVPFLELGALSQVYEFVKQILGTETNMMDTCYYIEFLQNFLHYRFKKSEESIQKIIFGTIEVVIEKLTNLISSPGLQMRQCFSVYCLNSVFINLVGKNPSMYDRYASKDFCVKYVRLLLDKITNQMKIYRFDPKKIAYNPTVKPFGLKSGSLHLISLYSNFFCQFVKTFYAHIPFENSSDILCRIMNCIHAPNIIQKSTSPSFMRSSSSSRDQDMDMDQIEEQEEEGEGDLMLDDDNQGGGRKEKEKEEGKLKVPGGILQRSITAPPGLSVSNFLGTKTNITEHMHFVYEAICFLIKKKLSFKKEIDRTRNQNEQLGVSNVYVLNKTCILLQYALLKERACIQYSMLPSDCSKRAMIEQLLIQISKSGLLYLPNLISPQVSKEERARARERQFYFHSYNPIEFTPEYLKTCGNPPRCIIVTDSFNFQWLKMYTLLPFWVLCRSDWEFLNKKEIVLDRPIDLLETLNKEDDIKARDKNMKKKLRQIAYGQYLVGIQSQTKDKIEKFKFSYKVIFENLRNQKQSEEQREGMILEIKSGRDWLDFLNFSMKKGYIFQDDPFTIASRKFKNEQLFNNNDKQKFTFLCDKIYYKKNTNSQFLNDPLWKKFIEFSKQFSEKNLEKKKQEKSNAMFSTLMKTQKDQLTGITTPYTLIDQARKLLGNNQKEIKKSMQKFMIDFCTSLKSPVTSIVREAYLKLYMVYRMKQFWIPSKNTGTLGNVAIAIIQHLYPIFLNASIERVKYQQNKNPEPYVMEVDETAKYGLWFLVLHCSHFGPKNFQEIFWSLLQTAQQFSKQLNPKVCLSKQTKIQKNENNMFIPNFIMNVLMIKDNLFWSDHRKSDFIHGVLINFTKLPNFSNQIKEHIRLFIQGQKTKMIEEGSKFKTPLREQRRGMYSLNELSTWD